MEGSPEEFVSEPATSGRRGRLGRGLGSAWLPRMLAESVLIVLSVLVALGVDEWRDQHARNARAEMALASIAAELQENIETLERARGRHVRKSDSLSVYATRGALPPPEVYMYGMFSPGLVQSTAWESAKETGATGDMPYELVLRLSRVYDRQERYRALAGAMTEDIMRDVRREGMDAVLRDRYASFIPLQLDFAGREASLLDAYEEALAELRLGARASRSAASPNEP